MVIIIKRLISILAAAVIVSACLTTNAITIDGTDRNNEWKNAQTITFFNNNNGTQAGVLSCIIDGFDAYFLLQTVDSNILSDDTDAGFVLCIDGEEIFRITMSEKVFNSNADKYYIEASIVQYDNTGVSCEAKVGIKHGIGKSLDGTVCFIDNEGVRSNVHSFSFANEEETVSAEPETTKEPTTGRTTATRKATTARNTTTVRTTTQKSVTESETDETAAYVYVKDNVHTNGTTEPFIGAETYDMSESALSSDDSKENNQVTKIKYYHADNTADSYNKGKKLKIAVCIASGVALLLISAWGATKIKSSDKKDKEKSDEENDKD